MKIVIQRVKNASVTTTKDEKEVGRISSGLLVLIGVAAGDTEEDADVLSEKLSKLRIIGDNTDKMNLSVIDAKEEILAVSQFTLYADTYKGNRPSFLKAAPPEQAEKLYIYFVERLKSYGIKVQTGSFGNYMDIPAKLDGPVTIILES